MKIAGRIVEIYPTRYLSERFHVREFVVQVLVSKKEQYVKFQLTQDDCNRLNDCTYGDLIEVDFEIHGREHQGKYFNTLLASIVTKM